jgi:hypothetical protein
VTNHSAHSFGAYPSVCGAASDLPNLVGSHNQMEDILFSYTSSQLERPLAILCLHSTTTRFPARRLIFSLMKILESLTLKM